MLNTVSEGRTFKDAVYGAFAEVAKAMASPGRLELLDLLAQGPRGVDALADGVGRTVATTSQHLQVLKRARVVETTRHGTRIEYRLAPGVADVFVVLRRLAEARSPTLRAAKADYAVRAEAVETIDPAALRDGLARGDVTLLDVRPTDEYAHAHLPGAISVPIDELGDRLDELPRDGLLVAVCRGPYCTYAAHAVRILRASGRRAVRFEQGVADWRFDGGPVARGLAP